MSVYDVRDALLMALERVYHFSAPQAVVDAGLSYAVWGETGIVSLDADDGPAEWAVSGVVYYYTPDEYDRTFDAICARLSEAGIAIRPGRIGYDDARRETAYEVEWTAEAEPCAVYGQPPVEPEEPDEEDEP